MNPKVSGILIFAVVLATFITGAVVYSHFGNFAQAFLLPIVILILWGLWALFPKIDPLSNGFRGFRHIYDLGWILIVSILAYVYALTLGKTLGWQLDVPQAVMPAIALLIFTLGALLPKLRRNWFFGIRTPWTLSSDEDWRKTHRLGRPLFMIASGLILLGTFMPRALSIALLVVPILLAAFISIIYSYFIFRRGRKS